ncbi:MAG: ATP-dependent Clp protease protease subunit [Pseudohongiellaceae bacterium]|jgi:ATP-dependent Clp protease protease subunit
MTELRHSHLDCDDKDKDDKDAPAAAMVGRTLLEKRVIMVTKPVDRDLMTAIVAQLLTLDSQDSTKPITMYINCPGGDADSGFGIYDVMKLIASPIATVCTGLAASAAIIIFLGGDKGSRFTTPNSRFLIHQPSTQSQGQASDLEITANEIIKTRDKYNAIISEQIGTPAKQIVKDASRDFWLNTAEALDYGLVDKIISSSSDLPQV